MQNKYIAFYGGKEKEIMAATSFDAQKEAAIQFKVTEKNRYKITVMLVETADGKEVVHSTSSI